MVKLTHWFYIHTDGVAMYKMSITLIVEVILLQLLHTSSSRQEECFNEGKIVTYECRVPAVVGTLDWNGVGFDCPSSNTIDNNVLPLPTTTCPLPFGSIHTGMCGPYSGNLKCTNDEADLISVLTFEANYEMNGGNISCLFHGGEIETFPVKVGVAPHPPSNVRGETRHSTICHFDWTAPNESSVGGIGGYKIHYGENCGNCTPAAGFVNQTEDLTADCSECIVVNSESNMMCSFQVNTVSKDCKFDSPLVEATNVILMPCILETSNSTRVKIHSVVGDIPPGIKVVPHNTQLNFSCDSNCTLESRCTNGTFQPSISPILRDECRCSDDSRYIIPYVLGSSVGGGILIVALLIFTTCIIILCMYWRKNRSKSTRISTEQLPNTIEMSRSGNQSYTESTGTKSSE